MDTSSSSFSRFSSRSSLFLSERSSSEDLLCALDKDASWGDVVRACSCYGREVRAVMITRRQRTGVGGLVRVLLALVESVLLLLLLERSVRDSALLVRLVHSSVADVGSRHDGCVVCVCGLGWFEWQRE
jgi:hypothetical protein